MNYQNNVLRNKELENIKGNVRVMKNRMRSSNIDLIRVPEDSVEILDERLYLKR